MRAAALLVCLGLLACRSDEKPPLTVFAASSLKELFEALPQPAPVRFHFAGSQQLRLQLEQGARADVFASADEVQGRALFEAGLVEAPRRLTCNALVIAVAKGNPHRVAGLEDLLRLERLILAAPEVPAGRYTQAMLARRGEAFEAALAARVVSRELNVRQVLTKLLLGEADAGLVYRTDALSAADRLDFIELPQSPRAVYEIALLRDSGSKAEAAAFIDQAVAAEALFRARGFVPCP